MPLREGQWYHPPRGRQPWGYLTMSRVLISTVILASKFWGQCLNTITVFNKETFEMTRKRKAGRGLLTVSNHSCCIDDPLVIGSLITFRQSLDREKFVWTSAAQDVAFGVNKFWSKFFTLGKVFPVVRGDGVYQKGMDFMVEELDLGNWCMIFPEGKINVTNEFMRLKWGVGRVIADCKKTPIVLPIWHVGMDDILPNKRPYIPLIRKKATVLIGEPIDFTEEVKELRMLKKTPKEMRKFLTDRVQDELKVLKGKAEAFHKECFHGEVSRK